MRLIDADELIEWINEQREQVTKKQVAGTDGSIFTREALVTMQRCISTFENKIRNQPTAFDKEQIIHNLECEKTIWVGKKITTTEVMKIDDAIDIVKKGGVE